MRTIPLIYHYAATLRQRTGGQSLSAGRSLMRLKDLLIGWKGPSLARTAELTRRNQLRFAVRALRMTGGTLALDVRTLVRWSSYDEVNEL